ncbi:hypothetical protein I6E72_08560 [Pseudoalteromonas sp. NSLLW24]|uniref:hypothetical protein n=1 Tax=Pseudoalteromonas sp. NSLLW24 TaxID=2792050 RepID=UPI0018CEBB89|nr:hypothetical protein [Pseudoalteromonas sp. NSLLW24]MBG9999014.1 hypothetical protein [Pseudoalteromonas sp. NSLLW24]
MKNKVSGQNGYQPIVSQESSKFDIQKGYQPVVQSNPNSSPGGQLGYQPVSSSSGNIPTTQTVSPPGDE